MMATTNTESVEQNTMIEHINSLERQLFQSTISTQIANLQSINNLEHLDFQVSNIQQAIRHTIPELRQEVHALRAELDSQATLTEAEQSVTRTYDEKIKSALRNPSLRRIVAGTYVRDGCSKAEGHIDMAESLERLAGVLRSRVHIGGQAYVLEAEDAEAMAHKMRETAAEFDATVSVFEMLPLNENNGEAGKSKVRTVHDAARNVSPSEAVTETHEHDLKIYTPVETTPDTAKHQAPAQEVCMAITTATEGSNLSIVGPKSIATLPEATNQTLSTTWQPSSVLTLKPLPASHLSTIPTTSDQQTFPRTFLLETLSGTNWTPSFYHTPISQRSLLPNRGFFLLSSSLEPLSPSSPGHHGTILSPVFHTLEPHNPDSPKPTAWFNAPLFISVPSTDDEDYYYFGMYSALQPTRLDLDHSTRIIPETVKNYWAKQLSSPRRPEWVTSTLKSHFVPLPTYPNPSTLTTSTTDVPVTSALENFMREAAAAARDADVKVSFLNEGTVKQLFEAGDLEHGIRFWGWGVKCEGWDRGFYDMMVGRKEEWAREEKKRKEKEVKW